MKKAIEKQEKASCPKAEKAASAVVPATVATDDGSVSFGAGSPLGLMAVESATLYS